MIPTVKITTTGIPNEAGPEAAKFTIDRGAETTGDITVFFTISGNAQQNIDYDIQEVHTIDGTVPTVTLNGKEGTVVIPDGQTSVDIKIVPRDDIVTDGGETVTLTLTEEPTGVPQQYDVSSTPGDETATLTITDNTNPTSKVVGANEIIISTNIDNLRHVFAGDVDGDRDVDVLSALWSNNKIKPNTKSIVIIDASVENYQQLLNGVVPRVKPFLLSGNTDGVQQIADILQKHPETDTLHIISHGSPGCLYLGNSQLSLDTLKGYEPQLQQWQLDNLLLYGCNVAARDGGEEFIDKLHRLTGAKIAASKSLTGAAVKGGNWELELRTAQTKPSLALEVEVMASYPDTLELQFEWAKKIGGSSDDQARSMTTDSNGNVLVAGNFRGEIDIDSDGNIDLKSNGSLNGYVAKFDINGSFDWAKEIGGSSDDQARSITTDSNGNILVAGNFQGEIDIDGDGDIDLKSNGSRDGYVAKFDINGSFDWAKGIGGSSNDHANNITTDSSGNILVAGDFQGEIDIDGSINFISTSGSRDGYVAKFDTNGIFDWAKGIGGIGDDAPSSITTDSNGNLLVAGNFQGEIDIDGDGNNDLKSPGNMDGYVAKFDSNGNLVLAKQIGGFYYDSLSKITTDSSGNVWVGGFFYDKIDIDDDGNIDLNSNGIFDGYAAKFDSDGNLVFAKGIGGSDHDHVYGITTDSSGNVWVVGDFGSEIDIDGDGDIDLKSNGSLDGYLAKFDINGSFDWAKEIGGIDEDVANRITTDSSGNVLVVGNFKDKIDIDGDGNIDLDSNGGRDGYVVKFSDDTNSPPTDLDLNNKTIDENVAPNSVVGTFSTTDPDSGDSFTYTLVTGDGDTDNSAFTINGDQLKINDSPDYETQSS
ncbi:MAG: DUF4347 domain-containing protein, partial [Trichodesmium sp. St2_bin2_1]|nr:DUF4347 domain-containing protein [Trichodesmium sp. St2_bin2_1]